MTTESEEQLLAKLAANHILLSQFELARAALRQLHVINAARTERFLTSVVELGGNVPNVLWSPAVPSPAHLAWLCCSELHALNATCDRDEAEFQLLLALLRESASALEPSAKETGGSGTGASSEDNETSEGGGADVEEALRAISDRRPWGIYTVANTDAVSEPDPPSITAETGGGLSEGALVFLNLLIGEEADIFQALSHNAARRQAGIVSEEVERKGRGLSVMHGLVQSAHVTAVTQLAASGSFTEAVGRLRYLCYEFGAQEPGPYRYSWALSRFVMLC